MVSVPLQTAALSTQLRQYQFRVWLRALKIETCQLGTTAEKECNCVCVESAKLSNSITITAAHKDKVHGKQFSYFLNNISKQLLE